MAAFNHAHIFIDPDPDPERVVRGARAAVRAAALDLARLRRVAHQRGRRHLRPLGQGHPALAARCRRCSTSRPDEATGEEVIRRILTAKVDLLYNGGIGTYVKASSEDDAEVGDRANDRVRVDGSDVRARVVGEGGNLGFTQRGRLEYWERGGLCNTDAVDNSGGVDMSDHEVNIKILLDLLVREGRSPAGTERNRILAGDDRRGGGAGARRQRQPGARHHPRRHAQRRALRGVRRPHRGHVVDARASAARTTPSRRARRCWPARTRERGLPRPLLAVLLGHTKM